MTKSEAKTVKARRRAGWGEELNGVAEGCTEMDLCEMGRGKGNTVGGDGTDIWDKKEQCGSGRDEGEKRGRCGSGGWKVGRERWAEGSGEKGTGKKAWREGWRDATSLSSLAKKAALIDRGRCMAPV